METGVIESVTKKANVCADCVCMCGCMYVCVCVCVVVCVYQIDSPLRLHSFSSCN